MSLHVNPILAAVAAILLASAIYVARNGFSNQKPLIPDTWLEYPLVKKTQISHNTAMFVLQTFSTLL
jgi:hypothetical protein